MLSDNLKSFRKKKGLSQEELAVKLNVVRQTVSKWEQGLSVPDSEMLIKIAEELDTSVSVLLGETVEAGDDTELKAIAAKLEILNEQFAKRNEKHRKIWRAVFVVIGVLALISLLQMLVVFLSTQMITNGMNADTSIIGGADGPTAILVSSVFLRHGKTMLTFLAGIVAVIGICKTKRR